MYVKRLQSNEIQKTLHLAWEVFEIDVAPTYPSEGVEEFKEFVSEEHMLPKAQSGEICFFGAVEDSELCGMSAIRQDGHIALLFVKKEWQRKGVARMLFYAMQQYCVIERAVVQMTVSATPNAVEAYKHLGFVQTNNEQLVDGIRFVPMAYVIKEATKIVTGGGKTSNKKTGFLLALLLIGFLGMLFFSGELIDEMMNYYQEENFSEENDKISNIIPDDIEKIEDEETGIEAISCYQSENLSYTIEEEVYTFYSDGKDGSYPMEFEVHYPRIEGIDSEQITKINQNLRDCAMSTVEVLYLNPSQDIKESMLKQKQPVLASYVTYNVTYATEEVISVVFEDRYVAGNKNESYVDLRTRNMNLKDGYEYQVKDIIQVSDEFMQEWKTRMEKEAPYAEVMNDLKTSEFYQILNGTILDGNYMNVWFVDAEGVQIGMTYHHISGNERTSGWITAPFTNEEVKAYASDDEFWGMIE